MYTVLRDLSVGDEVEWTTSRNNHFDSSVVINGFEGPRNRTSLE
jgi:hypothetical protein